MIKNILTQSKPTVSEFALSVHHNSDNDTQTQRICADRRLTTTSDAVASRIAAFPFFPSPEDWQNWLSGWNSCGYEKCGEPVLIRTI